MVNSGQDQNQIDSQASTVFARGGYIDQANSGRASSYLPPCNPLRLLRRVRFYCLLKPGCRDDVGEADGKMHQLPIFQSDKLDELILDFALHARKQFDIEDHTQHPIGAHDQPPAAVLPGFGILGDIQTDGPGTTLSPRARFPPSEKFRSVGENVCLIFLTGPVWYDYKRNKGTEVYKSAKSYRAWHTSFLPCLPSSACLHACSALAETKDDGERSEGGGFPK